MTFKHVYTLRPGETPTNYRDNPGELPGPWGETVEEALAALEEHGVKVMAYWDKEPDLWVIVDTEENEEPGSRPKYFGHETD